MSILRFSLLISLIACAMIWLSTTSLIFPAPAIKVGKSYSAPSFPLTNFPKGEEVIEVKLPGETSSTRVIHNARLFAEGWDTLAQTRFWRLVMNLPEDTSLINIAQTREILGTINTETYDSWKSVRRKAYKDSIKQALELPDSMRLYVTSGKRFYYKFKKVFPIIDRAIGIFEEKETDPWYAQAILLIESPGQLARSSAGAYGSFQLMRGVAIENGLKVNRQIDERGDPVKSAAAAARFIQRVCIPETREMLAPFRLAYQENDIWFRLLVLHVYHAGARNVAGVIRSIKPRRGGMGLIRRVWKTQYKGFGNASQNYSQVALASMMELDEIVTMECEYICSDG